MRVLSESSSIGVCVPFPFRFEVGMSALIVLVPDHCISSYFSLYIMHSKGLLNYLLTLLAANDGTLLFPAVISFNNL